MKKSFLDYYKVVLERVSFDQTLVEKEYKKALRLLNSDEQEQFRNWLAEERISVRQQSNEFA